tara:strand:- start:215 stop:934 length:720 start_codon:yes stop_codon:yes gene_type:complete
MSLPKIATPLFHLTLPSTEKQITYRPFLVKEEKLLMIAKEANDEESIAIATLQVLESCTNGEVNVNELASFDIEYLFLNIRAKSVGEEIELRYKHSGGINKEGKECNIVTPVNINIDDIKVKKNENHTDKIMLTDTIGIKMKYPKLDIITKLQDGSIENVIDAIADCVDFLFDEEQIYDNTTTSKEELIEFIETLSQEQLMKINKFFDTMPQLEHEVEYECAGCGQKDKVTLRGLSDFF